MSLHPRRRRALRLRRALRARLAALLWLTAAWALLWGDFRPGTLAAGALIGVLVLAIAPMPPLDFAGRVHPVQLTRLLLRFVADLVVASAQVAYAAFALHRTPQSAVIGVRLRSRSDLYLTLTAIITSLVPGSVIVEAHRMTGTLYIHVLDVGLSRGVEGARRTVLETEERVLRALGSDAELADAGLTRRTRGGGSR